MNMIRDWWRVGDYITGAGTPTLGKPYVVPTADENGYPCEMEIDDIVLLEDGRHYSGRVVAITPLKPRKAARVMSS